jgi:hypothetical protein
LIAFYVKAQCEIYYLRVIEARSMLVSEEERISLLQEGVIKEQIVLKENTLAILDRLADKECEIEKQEQKAKILFRQAREFNGLTYRNKLRIRVRAYCEVGESWAIALTLSVSALMFGLLFGGKFFPSQACQHVSFCKFISTPFTSISEK